MKFSAVVSALVVASAAAFAPSTTEVCFLSLSFDALLCHTRSKEPPQKQGQTKKKSRPHLDLVERFSDAKNIHCVSNFLYSPSFFLVPFLVFVPISVLALP